MRFHFAENNFHALLTSWRRRFCILNAPRRHDPRFGINFPRFQLSHYSFLSESFRLFPRRKRRQRNLSPYISLSPPFCMGGGCFYCPLQRRHSSARAHSARNGRQANTPGSFTCPPPHRGDDKRDSVRRVPTQVHRYTVCPKCKRQSRGGNATGLAYTRHCTRRYNGTPFHAAANHSRGYAAPVVGRWFCRPSGAIDGRGKASTSGSSDACGALDALRHLSCAQSGSRGEASENQ